MTMLMNAAAAEHHQRATRRARLAGRHPRRRRIRRRAALDRGRAALHPRRRRGRPRRPATGLAGRAAPPGRAAPAGGRHGRSPAALDLAAGRRPGRGWGSRGGAARRLSAGRRRPHPCDRCRRPARGPKPRPLRRRGVPRAARGRGRAGRRQHPRRARGRRDSAPAAAMRTPPSRTRPAGGAPGRRAATPPRTLIRLGRG